MKPAPWKFLVAALLLMAVGGGVTYWVLSMKLKAQFAARVPARPIVADELAPTVAALESRIAAGDASAVGELGDLYRGAGFAESAHVAFVTMFELDPSSPIWALKAAEMEIVLGRGKDAERRVKLTRVAGLPDGESYRLLGQLSEALGEQVDAKSDYEQAVKLDSTLDKTWMRLITLYRAIGDEGAARRALVSGLEANPESLVLLMDRGSQARDRGQWGKAEADFARVLELSPDEPIGYYALAQVLFQMSRHDEGEVLLQRVLSQNPDDRTALMLLCVEALVAEERSEVDRWYARLMRLADFDSGDRTRIETIYRDTFGEPPPESP